MTGDVAVVVDAAGTGGAEAEAADKPFKRRGPRDAKRGGLSVNQARVLDYLLAHNPCRRTYAAMANTLQLPPFSVRDTVYRFRDRGWLTTCRWRDGVENGSLIRLRPERIPAACLGEGADGQATTTTTANITSTATTTVPSTVTVTGTVAVREPPENTRRPDRSRAGASPPRSGVLPRATRRKAVRRHHRPPRPDREKVRQAPSGRATGDDATAASHA